MALQSAWRRCRKNTYQIYNERRPPQSIWLPPLGEGLKNETYRLIKTIQSLRSPSPDRRPCNANVHAVLSFLTREALGFLSDGG